MKKRNLGQKNETLAENRVSGTFSERFYREGGVEFGKNFSGWQIILLRHTGDFQKSVLLETSGPRVCDSRGPASGASNSLPALEQPSAAALELKKISGEEFTDK